MITNRRSKTDFDLQALWNWPKLSHNMLKSRTERTSVHIQISIPYPVLECILRKKKVKFWQIFCKSKKEGQ